MSPIGRRPIANQIVKSQLIRREPNPLDDQFSVYLKNVLPQWSRPTSLAGCMN